MASTKITNATVVSYSLVDDDVNNIYEISAASVGSNNTITKAYPLDVNIKRVPILGESVILMTSDSAETAGGSNTTRTYYMNSVGIQNNIHTNALPGSKATKSGESDAGYSKTAAGNPNASGNSDGDVDLGDGFEERDDVGSLQPFLGDILIEGRFGHSLRFGYSPKGSGGTLDPSWSASTTNDPITILSNGRGSAGSYNKFTIEDITADKSSIWLTSSQKIKLGVSNKIPSDIKSQADFDTPTIILNSDRLVLNSKTDWVVLSGAKSVAVATPGWAMDMDKMFTIIEGLIQQLSDLTSAKATYATGVGPTGPATNAADVAKLLSEFQSMGGGSNESPTPSAGSGGGSSNGGSSNGGSSQSGRGPRTSTKSGNDSNSNAGSANPFTPTSDAMGGDDTGGLDPTIGLSDSVCEGGIPPTWDTKYTDKRILKLHPIIRCDAANMINEAAAAGMNFRVSQALRTIEEQNKLYAKGRTTAGGIVTNARGGSSYHNYGLAFDVVLIKNGGVVWKGPDYAKLGQIGKKYGFEWGGDWTSFKDKPHFQKKFGKSTRQLMASVSHQSSPYPSESSLGIA